MSTQYFQEIISEARERHAINYLHATVSFEENGDVLYSVSLTLIIDPDAELPKWGTPKCYEMVHLMGSTQSLAATIDEAVRRCNFDNGLAEPFKMISEGGSIEAGNHGRSE